LKLVPDPFHNETKSSSFGEHRSAQISTLSWDDAKSSLARDPSGLIPKLNTGVRFPSSALDDVPAQRAIFEFAVGSHVNSP
jgi:hypothetical protein